MAGFDYSKLRATSIRLIEKFGRAVDVDIVTKVNDIASGTVTEQVSSTSTKAVVTEYKDKEIDGTTIKATDYRILVAPNDDFDEIRPDALITTRGKSYRVIRSKEVAPGDITLLHDVQARI